MGYLVLVHTESAKEAQELRTGHRVVGVYNFPARDTPTCDGYCQGGGRGLNGWGRHRDMGHMLHATCRRRTKHWRKVLTGALFDTLGVNLLKRKSTPVLFQNPKGWGK